MLSVSGEEFLVEFRIESRMLAVVGADLAVERLDRPLFGSEQFCARNLTLSFRSQSLTLTKK
jgi:hypothetical protein